MGHGRLTYSRASLELGRERETQPLLGNWRGHLQSLTLVCVLNADTTHFAILTSIRGVGHHACFILLLLLLFQCSLARRSIFVQHNLGATPDGLQVFYIYDESLIGLYRNGGKK